MKMKYSKLAREVTSADWELLTRYPNFCTGKTTGEVLSIVGRAMQNPEKIQFIETGNWYHNRDQFDAVRFIIDTLNLRHFTMRCSDLSIVYNPYGYVEKTTDTAVIWTPVE